MEETFPLFDRVLKNPFRLIAMIARLEKFLVACLLLLVDITCSLSSSSSSSSARQALVQPVVSIDPESQQRRFMYMSKEQDEELKRLGDYEAELMANKPIAKLKPTKINVSNRSGFGKISASSGKKNEKANTLESINSDWKEQARVYALVLRAEGLVCIPNVLADKLADDLRNYLIDLRARATSDIENGIIVDSQERFADVLLNQNRCDLKIPIGPAPVNDALCHLLASKQTVLRDLIEAIYESYGNMGSEASLYELNCFMSNSGARRQLVHADNVCVEHQEGLHPDEPIMLTCFVALQDVDETMGPTIFIPGTHNLDAHVQFFETERKSGDESTKDRLLRSRKSVMGTLSKGSCILFDPRTLHCAGGNSCADPARTRALFYFSFKNPRVADPGCPSCGGYGIADAEITMRQLCEELNADKRLATFRTIDMLASFP